MRRDGAHFAVTPTPLVIKRGVCFGHCCISTLSVIAGLCLISTIGQLSYGSNLRDDAAKNVRSKRTAAYDELVTEWTGTHLPRFQAKWTGANAFAIPNVTVSRGAGANAGATGGILTADTGGALVVETDTEDAIGTLPDPENDYLRYDSGLVLKAQVLRFHDSRWATESDNFTLTVGDGDDAVSFDGIAAYKCDVLGDTPGSYKSDPLHLTKITIVMDEALSDGRFVVDATLPKCALEYSFLISPSEYYVRWIRFNPSGSVGLLRFSREHSAEPGCGSGDRHSFPPGSVRRCPSHRRESRPARGNPAEHRRLRSRFRGNLG